MSDNDVVKNLSLMFGALIALAVVIFIIANVIGAKPVTTSSANNESVVARIEPIGKLFVAKAVSAVANAVVPVAQAAAGGDTYNTACMACHATGAAGAPKLGDKAAWAPRIAKGNAALYKTAIEGKGSMPPKGGRADMSDDVIKAAVDYMISKSK
ncbi:MAG: cytochrome c5 family protein [Acidiferrobacterales bacterium]